MALIRLDKYVSNALGKTRTEVKQLLKKGQITVNGNPAKKPETKIDQEQDVVCCQGTPVCFQQHLYYMLNKPAGYLSATQDSRQPVVLDLIQDVRKSELFPVGRLDIDTVGLLLLTNDGELAHELLSPKKHVDKTYYARIQGAVTEEDCKKFQEGLEIGEEKRTMPAFLHILKSDTESEIEVTIQEGKFHQVKRMFHAVGKEVLFLKRISMGSLHLDADLAEGACRSLTEDEITELKKGRTE